MLVIFILSLFFKLRMTHSFETFHMHFYHMKAKSGIQNFFRINYPDIWSYAWQYVTDVNKSQVTAEPCAP